MNESSTSKVDLNYGPYSPLNEKNEYQNSIVLSSDDYTVDELPGKQDHNEENIVLLNESEISNQEISGSEQLSLTNHVEVIEEYPEEYKEYIELVLYSSLFKVLCGLLMTIALISVIFGIYFLAGGLLIGAYGIWVAQTMRKFYMFIFILFFVMEILAEIIGGIIEFVVHRKESGGIFVFITHIILVLCRIGISLYLLYKWKKLPQEGLKRYYKFISNQNPSSHEYVA